MIHVYSIPQVDGATLLVALDASDYATVQRDHAMVDYVDPLACLEVERDGAQQWVRLLRGRDTHRGRAAIRAYVAEFLVSHDDDSDAYWGGTDHPDEVLL
ncbi:MAG: hypothetical protein L0206_22105 [Actinobacteria bacterium]|nr:hypothetical protein [Actinomycetota bacterium]